MIRAVLFDLDGTLLPMDNDEFTRTYFGLLAKRMAPHGYEAQKLVDGIWAGTAAMVKNDGRVSNEQAFWQEFSHIFGEKVWQDIPLFEEFYRTDFQKARAVCGFAPEAAEIVRMLKERGITVGLSTNPIFPAIATESRIRWAGLEPEDFAFYTTYENIGLCKPNPDYYREAAARAGVSPEECLMVGNDIEEDMVACEKAGMRGFLLTDCLIDRKGTGAGEWPNGGFCELASYIGLLLAE